ncbi:hypothetical protein BGX33_000687 [Mortierella sp. NVP41]|nr:hypothetical protein BGX33_000687 [Mortierella sp. NVP41]
MPLKSSYSADPTVRSLDWSSLSSMQFSGMITAADWVPGFREFKVHGLALCPSNVGLDALKSEHWGCWELKRFDFNLAFCTGIDDSMPTNEDFLKSISSRNPIMGWYCHRQASRHLDRQAGNTHKTRPRKLFELIRGMEHIRTVSLDGVGYNRSSVLPPICRFRELEET